MTDSLDNARRLLAEAGCLDDFPDLELQFAKDETRTYIESKEFFLAGETTIANLFVGRRSYILGGGLLSPSTVIGRYCSIANNTGIGLNQHRMTWLSTGLLPPSSAEPPPPEPKQPLTVIGSDVWIGLGAVIMDGIRIGHGAVVGAGAVVTHDVAPYSIVVGVPGKPIRKRFSDDLIAGLLETAWWRQPEEIIRLLPHHDPAACVEFLSRL